MTNLLDSITDKDVAKVQEVSLTHQDKLRRDHIEYEKRSSKKIDFWEFIARNQKLIK